MYLAPIVLFVYNRPEHTRKNLESLLSIEEAKHSEIYIFSDGPRENDNESNVDKIREVRKIINSIRGFKSINIIEEKYNKGLASSVISGVTKVLCEHEHAIILEDDLLYSQGILKYFNDALRKYKNVEKVMMISGYMWPVDSIKKNKSSFFIPHGSTQAWATWQRAWAFFDPNAEGYEILKKDKRLRKRFNMNGAFSFSNMLFKQMETSTIDSWAIRFYYSIFQKNGLVLFPDKSLIYNTGWDGSGIHSDIKNPFYDDKWDPNYEIQYFPDNVSLDHIFYYKIQRYYRKYISPKKKFTDVIKIRIYQLAYKLFLKH